MESVASRGDRLRWLRGTGARAGRLDRLAHVLLIIFVLGLATLLLDGRAYLGTDTGGKVATLEAMEERGDWSPDVGYWAEEWDPEGRYHPMFGTTPTEAGWVQVTSLPMVLAARPLYELGGYRLALAVPIAGTVLAALAAAALADRVGGAIAGRRALLVTGLASPLAVYALDLWEHSFGVAGMAWAAVVAFDVAIRRRPPWTAVVAGGLLGVAATMRTEAFVYSLTIVGAMCVATLARRSVPRAVGVGAAAAAGFGAVWAANVALERSLDAVSRSDRATGAVRGAANAAESDAFELGRRFEEGMDTTFSMMPIAGWAPVLLGALSVAIIATAVRWGQMLATDRRRMLMVVMALPFVILLLSGLGFVPGLFAAYPVAAAALAVRRDDGPAIWIVGLAAVSLPIVWAFQYLGGAGPQWGGRYVLTSAFLFGAVGIVVLSRPDVPSAIRGTVIGLSFGVTVFGLAWLVHRSDELADFFDNVTTVQQEALIGRNHFFLREVGPLSLDRQWLSAPGDGDLSGPVNVLRDAGIETFSVLQHERDPEAVEPGTRHIGIDRLELLGTTFEVHHFRILERRST